MRRDPEVSTGVLSSFPTKMPYEIGPRTEKREKSSSPEATLDPNQLLHVGSVHVTLVVRVQTLRRTGFKP